MPFNLLPVPRMQFLDANGSPLAGGKVYTYAAGTSAPLATYTDSSGTIQNSNPVILDSGGFASIWIGASSYKIVVKDLADVQQYVVDNVSAASFGPATTDSISNKTLTAPGAANVLNVLNLQYNLPTITGIGVGNYTPMVNFSLQPNQLGLNEGIRISAGVNKLLGSASITYRLRLGTTALSDTVISTSGQSAFEAIITNSGGGTAFKIDFGWRLVNGTGTPVAAAANLPVDWTQPQTLSLLMNAATTEQANVTFWQVTMIH